MSRIDINMNQERNSFLYFGLGIFASVEKYDAIVQVIDVNGVLCFQTASGLRGFLERNTIGDWDVWVGVDLISVMESDVYDLLMQQNRNVHEDYRKLDTMILNAKSTRSVMLLQSMKQAIENILEKAEAAAIAEGMKGSTVIGDEEYIYAKGIRMIHHLN